MRVCMYITRNLNSLIEQSPITLTALLESMIIVLAKAHSSLILPTSSTVALQCSYE